jgi:hypothetical protein
MAHKLVLLIIAVLSFVVLNDVPAAAQDVKYDFVAGTDFSKFKTYKWRRAEKARYPEPTSDQILIRTIDEQLSAKGLTKTESDSADLFVIYQLAVTEDVEWSSFTNDIQWQSGANSLPGFRGATTNSTDMIRKGWLMVDIYDSSQKKLVWQASATKTLGKGTDPKKMERNARKAMAKVFSNYPPSQR